MTDTDQILLDVGGKTFKTSKTTLLLSGSLYFKGRFTTGAALMQRDSSAIFIDRDGALFDEVLFFMRTRNLRAKTRMTGTTLMDLFAEAKFFVFDDLKTACTDALNELKLSIAKKAQPRGCTAKFYALVVTATRFKRFRIPEGAILHVASATLAGRCRVDRYQHWQGDSNPDFPYHNNPGCFLGTCQKEDTGDFQLYLCPTGVPNEKALCIAHVGMDQIHVGRQSINFDFRHDIRVSASPTSNDRRILLATAGSGEWHVSCWVGRPDEIPGLASAAVRTTTNEQALLESGVLGLGNSPVNEQCGDDDRHGSTTCQTM